MNKQDVQNKILALDDGPLGTAVAAMYAACEHKECDFSVHVGAKYALARVGSSLWSAGKERTPRDEQQIIALCGAAGITEFYAASPALFLPGWRVSALCRMRFKGPAAPLPGFAPSDAKTVAPLLATVAELPTDSVYCSLFYREKFGVSRAYVLKKDAQTAAVAVADYICGGRSVIGSVCVAPDFRGYKLGFAAAAAAAEQTGGDVRLLCRPALACYYAAVGFVRDGYCYVSARKRGAQGEQ